MMRFLFSSDQKKARPGSRRSLTRSGSKARNGLSLRPCRGPSGGVESNEEVAPLPPPLCSRSVCPSVRPSVRHGREDREGDDPGSARGGHDECRRHRLDGFGCASCSFLSPSLSHSLPFLPLSRRSSSPASPHLPMPFPRSPARPPVLAESLILIERVRARPRPARPPSPSARRPSPVVDDRRSVLE